MLASGQTRHPRERNATKGSPPNHPNQPSGICTGSADLASPQAAEIECSFLQDSCACYFACVYHYDQTLYTAPKVAPECKGRYARLSRHARMTYLLGRHTQIVTNLHQLASMVLTHPDRLLTRLLTLTSSEGVSRLRPPTTRFGINTIFFLLTQTSGP